MGARLPWGTLLVNLLGSFLLVALVEISRLSAWVSSDTRRALGIGFLGSFTTFSTFGVETFRAIEAGSWTAASWNVVLNVVEVVDTEERIQDLLPTLDEMIGGGLVTLERVRVIRYRPHPVEPPSQI